MTNPIITKLATDCAATIIAQNFPDEWTYFLLPGDEAALRDALGREPERSELLEFERAIGAALNHAVDGEWNAWSISKLRRYDS